jgi:hypothetical protein
MYFFLSNDLLCSAVVHLKMTSSCTCAYLHTVIGGKKNEQKKKNSHQDWGASLAYA